MSAPRRHPRQVAHLAAHELPGDVAGVQDRRGDRHPQRSLDVLADARERAHVHHVSGYHAVPHGDARGVVEHQHQARLEGGGAHAMGGERVGRVVGQAVGERRGVDVAAGPEGGVGGPRRRDERAEEGHLRRVGAHRVEVGAVAPERRHRHVREQVRRGRAGHEVVAGDARAVPGRRARQVREQPPAVPVPREGLPRDARQPRPSRGRGRRQAVSRHDVGGGLRELRRLVGERPVAPPHRLEAVGVGVVAHQAPRRRAEHAAAAALGELHDPAQPLAHPLARVVPGPGDVLHVHHRRGSAHDPARLVPHDLLRTYEWHPIPPQVLCNCK